MNTPTSFLKEIPQLLPDNSLVQSRAKLALQTGQYESCLKLISDIRLLMDENCWIGNKAKQLLNELKTEHGKAN